MRMRAPGFAATLLAEIPLSHSVWVSIWRCAGTRDGGQHRFGRTDPASAFRFPASWDHRLIAQHSADDQMVSDGPLPIYYHRTALDPGVEQTLNYPAEGHCSRCLEIDYLAELAGTARIEVDRVVDWQTALRWSNSLQFNAELSRALMDQELALKHLASSLGSAGVLDTRRFRWFCTSTSA